MKKQNKFLAGIVICLLLLIATFYIPITAVAEEVEKEIVTLDSAGSLTVMFTYDNDKPTIVFISPSGKEYSEAKSSEAELEKAHGDGWSTYKIVNAEAGSWKVRCDKKNNAEVKYSVVDEVKGICIQSFSLVAVNNNVAKVSFSATKGDEVNVYYDYKIYAINGEDVSSRKLLTQGSAPVSEIQEIDVKLNLSSHNGYRLLLEVFHRDGIETYDTMTSDSFNYTNPDEPQAISDFYAYVNMDNLYCQIDWEEYKVDGYGLTYTVLAIADDDKENPIYVESLDDVTNTGFSYPAETKKLSVSLYYNDNGVLSAAKTKDISIGNEYLKTVTEDITGDTQLELSFKTSGETSLEVEVNGEKGMYNVKEEDSLYFPLNEGSNEVYASLKGINNVFYVVDKEVFRSTVAPIISIYEDLNGKVFQTDTAVITGKADYANKLTINGAEVSLNESGEFEYSLKMDPGRNEVIIVASSGVNLSSSYNMIITRDTSDIVDVIEKNDFIPLLISVSLSLLIIAYGLLFIGKKNEKKKLSLKKVLILITIISGVVDGIVIAILVYLHSFNNGAKYIQVLKESREKAVLFLEYERKAILVLIVVSVMFVISIISLILVATKKKSK